jgi:hypothetical protein
MQTCHWDYSKVRICMRINTMVIINEFNL